jgi:hypothetical protein
VRVLIDEDTDVRVGSLLAAAHDVDHARDVFGIQTVDTTNVAWCRAQGATLVTGDGALARKLRGSRQCACLHLRDLKTAELDRVRELLAVIEAEAAVQGERFWMQIGPDSYLVGR